MERQELFNKEIEQIMSKEKCLSFSALKAFMQSPKHFFKYKMDKEVTTAMEEGKMFHMATLEPDKFKSKYWVLDDSEICEKIGGAKPRATTKYKEWLAEETAKHDSQEQISKDKFDLFNSMSEYLSQCTATKDLMSGLIEREKFIEFEHEGFLINGYVDGIGTDYIIDLKKVVDASFKKIRWTIQDMILDMQAGIYCHALMKSKYYLIFIDNQINVTVVKLSSETIRNGFGKFDVAVNEFRRCVEEDLFYSSYEFFNGGYIEV